MVFIYSSFASDRKENSFSKGTRERHCKFSSCDHVYRKENTTDGLQPRRSPEEELLIAVPNTPFVDSDYSALFLDSVLEGDMKIKSAIPFKADKPPTRFSNR